jgi:hypothetical protein
MMLILNIKSFNHGVATEDGMLGFSEWLGFWHFCYRQWGGHMLLVST